MGFCPPSERMSTLKGKNLLPFEAYCFLLEYTHFQKRNFKGLKFLEQNFPFSKIDLFSLLKIGLL